MKLFAGTSTLTGLLICEDQTFFLKDGWRVTCQQQIKRMHETSTQFLIKWTIILIPFFFSIDNTSRLNKVITDKTQFHQIVKKKKVLSVSLGFSQAPSLLTCNFWKLAFKRTVWKLTFSLLHRSVIKITC